MAIWDCLCGRPLSPRPGVQKKLHKKAKRGLARGVSSSLKITFPLDHRASFRLISFYEGRRHLLSSRTIHFEFFCRHLLVLVLLFRLIWAGEVGKRKFLSCSAVVYCLPRNCVSGCRGVVAKREDCESLSPPSPSGPWLAGISLSLGGESRKNRSEKGGGEKRLWRIFRGYIFLFECPWPHGKREEELFADQLDNGDRKAVFTREKRFQALFFFYPSHAGQSYSMSEEAEGRG